MVIVLFALLILWNLWQERQIHLLGKHVNLLVDRANLQMEIIKEIVEKSE